MISVTNFLYITGHVERYNKIFPFRFDIVWVDSKDRLNRVLYSVLIKQLSFILVGVRYGTWFPKVQETNRHLLGDTVPYFKGTKTIQVEKVLWSRTLISSQVTVKVGDSHSTYESMSFTSKTLFRLIYVTGPHLFFVHDGSVT